MQTLADIPRTVRGVESITRTPVAMESWRLRSPTASAKQTLHTAIHSFVRGRRHFSLSISLSLSLSLSLSDQTPSRNCQLFRFSTKTQRNALTAVLSVLYFYRGWDIEVEDSIVISLKYRYFLSGANLVSWYLANNFSWSLAGRNIRFEKFNI